MMDGNTDKEWGCGWRSLQTLLSQIGIFNDVWTLAFELRAFTGDPDIVFDYDRGEISMADLSQISPYFVNIAINNGYTNANFDMLMINNLEALNNITSKLNAYYNNEGNTKILGLFGTGGNVACIAGYQKMDDKDMIYLIDPHGDSPEMNFENCDGIGRGGQGWVDLKESVLFGNHIFKKTDNDFLEFNPAIIVLFNNFNVETENVETEDVETENVETENVETENVEINY